MLKRYLADLADQFPEDRDAGHDGHARPGDTSQGYGKTFHLTRRFEYRRLDRTVHEGLLGDAELNALGAEGWDLAGVVGDSAGTHYYLKRSRGG